MNLSLRAKISLVLAVLIMLAFFMSQSSIVLGYSQPTLGYAKFGYWCLILFMFPFFGVVTEFLRKSGKRQQEIDDKLKAIDSANSVIEFDLEGNIRSSNKNFCKLFGYEKNELADLKHKNFIDRTEISDHDYGIFWWNLRCGRIVQGQFKRLTKDGNEIWIYGTYSPIQDQYGQTYKVLLIATDITSQKETEMEVSKKNGYLEHAAKILRHDMHSGINTYIPRGLSSLKRRMTAEQIKELKIDAPLRMIEEGLQHTQKVYKGVKEFTNLVKQDAQLSKESHNLKEIVSGYLEMTSYGKQVVIEELPTVDVNDALFCTAIDNLIRNGLKYNDANTKIVKIYMETESTLVVEDNGRGMTQSEFSELSKPYTRKKDQKETGSGLGLNICIAIMREHGFTVTAEKIDPGTKLRIKIK
jgi:PAS domain S-box-containing protein